MVQPYYKGGDNYIIDMMSGFKIRASRARQIPAGQTGGLWVAPERYEEQHPQDRVTGVPDDQTVAVSNPRNTTTYSWMVTGTAVTALAAAGATSLTVESTVGFDAGSRCTVPLDSGDPFQFTVTSTTATTLNFATPLPSSVGALFGDPLLSAVIRLG